MPTLDELRLRFSKDHFATVALGAKIQEAEPGRAVCSATLGPDHMNACGAPMGGAIFTLADFAFAVASNGFTDKYVVSQHISITFLSSVKGKTLTAEARCVKTGRSTCFYTVDIFDDAGSHVAYATVNGFITG